MQLSEILGVPLDKLAKEATDSLTQQLKQYSWFIDIQCNPIDKQLTVRVDAYGDFSPPFGYAKFLPKEWKGYKINSYAINTK